MKAQWIRRGGLRTGGMLAVAMLISGCLGRSPEVHHFVLGTTGVSTDSLTSAGPSEIAVMVGPARLPAYLKRTQIARLEAGGEVELDDFNRWLGGFEENFLRALSGGIARELGSARVVAYPSKAPFPLEYRVRLHIDDLIAEGAGRLRARLRWALIEEPGPRSEAAAESAQLFVIEEDWPIEGGSSQAIVAAHDVALTTLSRQIADVIRARHAGR